MQFRLLGPVVVCDGDRTVDVGHAKQRSVLAVLLMDVARVVPTAVLIDRVWGNDPPDSALNVLYGYVCRLRKALTPVGVPLVRRSGGYLLDIAADAVDVHRFRSLAAQAQATDEPERVASVLDEALVLWHGPALTGLVTPWAVHVRRLLDAERLAALTRRNEVYLDRSRRIPCCGASADGWRAA